MAEANNEGLKKKVEDRTVMVEENQNGSFKKKVEEGASDEGWTTVTKDNKKRVMRKRRSGRTTNAVAHPTSSMHGVIGNKNEIITILASCKTILQETTFFQHCMEQLQIKERQLLNNATVTIANFDDDKNSERRAPPTPLWAAILCLGLGNFGKTDRLEYSASLWQLSFLLLLREELQRKLACSMTPSNHGDNTNRQTIPIKFFDPASTEFEISFLMDQLGIEVLSGTAVDPQQQQSMQLIESRILVPTIVFMPHCPLELYEKLLACNVVHPNQHSSHQGSVKVEKTYSSSFSFCVIGNSLINYCDSIQTPIPIPCIRAARNGLHEIPLPFSSEDRKTAFGNFVGAFNDTYLTYFYNN
ncbi:hypothetical protein ACA910_001709 [Epithemia clementina (nom. ined.)]